MVEKNIRHSEGAKATEESIDTLKVRIRELEKEVEHWKSQVKNVRYGLNWMDVPEAFDKDSENKIPILEEVVEKAVDGNGPLASKPPHVIIEGDNYHALTCLNYTHRGKIDVIYIDPPYNTGSDGFTYKDKRFLTEFPDGQKVPKEHPLRHSYWLSFMEKRLKLAKNLLSDKGVIFISIDDNEQANLKLLCDKVFGEGNFVGQICRITTKRIKGDVTNINVIHDYVLVYAKHKFIVNHKIKNDYGIYEYEDEFVAERGRYLIRPLDNGSISYSVKSDYIINAPDGTIIVAGGNEEKRKQRIAGNHGTKDWCFRWSENKLKWGLENSFIVFKESKGKWRCYFKIYQFVDNNLKPTEKVDNFTTLMDGFYNNQGTSEIKDLLGTEGHFAYPKPLSLLMELERMAGKDLTILDFFAGSGTTLHATLNLNKEDGGCRKCILVQQSEGDNNICENVTYERNRRVMCGYTNAKGETVKGLGGSLKYYKTNFVGKHQSKNANDADKVELAEKAGCLIALAENTLEMVTVPDSAKGFWQIYSDKNDTRPRYTCIYHNGDYDHVSAFINKIDELRSIHKKSKFMVYVFSWNSPDFFENEFDDLKNIEIKAIPKPILEIYKALNG